MTILRYSFRSCVYRRTSREIANTFDFTARQTTPRLFIPFRHSTEMEILTRASLNRFVAVSIHLVSFKLS